MKKRIIFGIVAALFVFGAIYGTWWGTSDNQDEQRFSRLPAVEVEQVRRGSIQRTLKAVGTLRANQQVKMHAEIHGIVSRVYVSGGDRVTAGKPLLALDNRMYEAQLKDAKAQLALAKTEFARAAKLESGKFGTLKAKEKTFADLQKAEAAVELAALNLERTVIRAPFDGLASLSDIDRGDYVTEQQDLMSIVDIDPMKVEFRIPAQHILALSRNQQIWVMIDGFGDKEFDGQIEAINPKVDPAAHSVLVRGVLSNKLNVLKPGLFARVELVAGSKDNVLLIPEVAVQFDGENSYVYQIVDFQGKQVALKRSISVGLTEGNNVEVVRGLQEGDYIITSGQFKVRDTTIVRVINADLEGLVEEVEAQEETVEKTKESEAKTQEKQAEEQADKIIEEAIEEVVEEAVVAPPKQPETINDPGQPEESPAEELTTNEEEVSYSEPLRDEKSELQDEAA